MIRSSISGLVIASMLLCTVAFIPVARVQAQANPATVPTDCGISLTCIQNNWKTFIGDRLAVVIANQLIQRMTASVVNWINTGFEGSPAFLTNPEGFFTDVGDQITGELISKTGATSLLCAPFSFDIRLNLALNQTSSMNKRYACTLSAAIQRDKNAVANTLRNSGVNITGSADGVTLGNFINGDFSQGGWEGFLVYTTQPQNNPIGAWLMAKSDLESKIAEKKAAVNQDLNRGQGFLSWQKCTDVTSQFYDSSLGGESLGLTGAQESQLVYGGNKSITTGATSLGKPTSVRTKTTMTNGVPSTTYEQCQTQTPGSAIASSLFNQADTGREKLVSVKTISDSIDAITGALVNQMLTQGLAALSKNGSGVGQNSRAYLTELYEESYNNNSAESQSINGRSQSTTNSIVNLAQDNINKYNETLSLLNGSKDKYLAVRTCFTNKMAQLPQNGFGVDEQRAYGQRMVNGIDLVIARNLDPNIASTSQKKVDAIVALNNYQAGAASSTLTRRAGVTQTDITNGFSRVENAVSGTLTASQTTIESSTVAMQAYQTTQTFVTNTLDKDAATFQTICNQFPYSGGWYQAQKFVNPLLSGLQ